MQKFRNNCQQCLWHSTTNVYIWCRQTPLTVASNHRRYLLYRLCSNHLSRLSNVRAPATNGSQICWSIETISHRLATIGEWALVLLTKSPHQCQIALQMLHSPAANCICSLAEIQFCDRLSPREHDCSMETQVKEISFGWQGCVEFLWLILDDVSLCSAYPLTKRIPYEDHRAKVPFIWEKICTAIALFSSRI